MARYIFSNVSFAFVVFLATARLSLADEQSSLVDEHIDEGVINLLEKEMDKLVKEGNKNQKVEESVGNYFESYVDGYQMPEEIAQSANKEDDTKDPSLEGTKQNIDNETSTNMNDSSNVPSHRWPCKPFNITARNENNTNTTFTGHSSAVIINNETEFSSIFARMNSTHGCGLLLFYSPHCEFCTNLAPLYNAVGRSYPDLAVMAVNVQETMRMAAGYGVVGIPTIFFFYSGRPVSKFNQSRNTASFRKFVRDLSGFEPITSDLNITDADREGPIETRVVETRDYYLMFSVCFLVLYLVFRFLGQKLLAICMYAYDSIKSIDFWTRPTSPEEEKEKTD